MDSALPGFGVGYDVRATVASRNALRVTLHSRAGRWGGRGDGPDAKDGHAGARMPGAANGGGGLGGAAGLVVGRGGAAGGPVPPPSRFRPPMGRSNSAASVDGGHTRPRTTSMRRAGHAGYASPYGGGGGSGGVQTTGGATSALPLPRAPHHHLSSSASLLQHQVHGDSRARVAAAEVVRITTALNSRLPADGTCGGTAGDDLTALGLYASALRTISESPAIRRGLGPGVQDLLLLVASGVHTRTQSLHTGLTTAAAAAVPRPSLGVLDADMKPASENGARHGASVAPSAPPAPPTSVHPTTTLPPLLPAAAPPSSSRWGGSEVGGGASGRSSDDDSDGFGRWAPPAHTSPAMNGVSEGRPAVGEHDDRDIARVIREPSPMRSAAHGERGSGGGIPSPPPPRHLPPIARSPIPRLGISLAGGGPVTAAMVGAASPDFQAEFMSNQDGWSQSWRDEAAATVKTTADVVTRIAR